MAIDFGEMLKGVFGGKKAEQPVSGPQQSSVEAQVATHQATIQESQNKIDQMVGMDPLPQDRPLIDMEQAKIASAREAISNLQPTPPTSPETPPPAITQIPVANPEAQPIVNPTVAMPPAEEQKAA